MEPNKISNEQLASLIEQGSESDLSYEEIMALMMETARRLRQYDALRSQIDGMIERPKVEVVRTVGGWYEVTVNGDVHSLTRHEQQANDAKRILTKALGMDEAKEGGEE